MKTVLLTGTPGVGKTTLIKKLSEELQKESINFIGFYTEEVRNENHQRIGFDIRSFDGHHSILARNDSNLVPDIKTNKRIGQYNVYAQNLDGILQNFVKNESPPLVVIDEIGSMELISNEFQNYMKSILINLKLGKVSLVATIALNNKRNNVIIDQLKNSNETTLIEVTKTNRNHIYSVIFEKTMNLIKP